MTSEQKKRYDESYFELAEQYEIDLYPFFLAGVSWVHEYNQSDNFYPNKDGVDKIVANILLYVTKFVTKLNLQH